MKTSVMAAFALTVLVIKLGATAASQVTPDATKITGSVDHILATLPTSQFDAIAKFLAERFPESWIPQPVSPSKSTLVKGLLVTKDGKTYVEL